MQNLIRITCLQICFFGSVISKAQLSKYFIPKSEPGYMGLASGSVNFGYQGYRNHETFLGNVYISDRNNGPFASFSLHTSFLSNYYWSRNSDKKIKFGFTEKVEIGAGVLNNTTETNSPFAVNPSKKKFFLPLIIEEGFGAVFKINDKTDVGITYYFYSISTFHNKSLPESGYLKFRGRYHRYMAEISAFGRSVIDLKYLTNGEEDRSSTYFVGLTYTAWSEEARGVGGGYVKERARQFFFSIGTIF